MKHLREVIGPAHRGDGICIAAKVGGIGHALFHNPFALAF
jgi:hypothetical protein